MSTAQSAPANDPSVIPATEKILQLIYQGTATATGEDFFRALVRATATAMQVYICFVAEFAGCRERVRTLAYWRGSDFTDNVEFDL
jgi:hypothetical protein